ncbi:MAG: cobalamin-dependent protein [Nanoarchaeota archaeon]|nr:cobalamin-dependent protein [Nanoarchaeota archaeon]
MVKVLFVHKTHPIEPLGIGYLSSSIAREGHETQLILTSSDLEKAVEEVSEKIQEYKPEVLAQSIIFGSHGYAIELNKKVREKHPNLISILGGPAATFTPIIIERGFDAICRYEGEYPFLEFCNALENGDDVGNIPNLWVKPNPNKAAKRMLLEFSFYITELKEEELTIETEKRHHYSKEYIILTQDFYLN